MTQPDLTLPAVDQSDPADPAEDWYQEALLLLEKAVAELRASLIPRQAVSR